MGTTLHTLKPNPGANRDRKRVGRGHGSGLHKTSGKGMKGQKARTGHHGIPKPGFEGGQTSLARRLPKRGFNNKQFQQDICIVNIGDIAETFPAGSKVDVAALKTARLISRGAKFVKVLGSGDVGHTLSVSAHYFSASARTKIEEAKGAAVVIAQPTTYRREGGPAAKKQAKTDQAAK